MSANLKILRQGAVLLILLICLAWINIDGNSPPAVASALVTSGLCCIDCNNVTEACGSQCNDDQECIDRCLEQEQICLSTCTTSTWSCRHFTISPGSYPGQTCHINSDCVSNNCVKDYSSVSEYHSAEAQRSSWCSQAANDPGDPYLASQCRYWENRVQFIQLTTPGYCGQ